MSFLNRLAPYAHWLLRLSLASVFLYHGLSKFPTLSGFAQMTGLPMFIAVLVALLESLGGLLVLIGGVSKDWVTRIGALFIAPVMVGAIVLFHWGAWNTFAQTETHPMGGMEFQVVLLFVSLYLLIKGNAVQS